MQNKSKKKKKEKDNYHIVQGNIMAEANTRLYFDPDLNPDSTLKKFTQFIQLFKLRYDAQYPDPPKGSMDAAIERWKFCNPDKKLDMSDYDDIRLDWISKDMVAKFLGIFSSPRMYEDWQAALPDEAARKKVTWKEFVQKMQEYYHPTENLTLKNYQFRTITQGNSESFSAFCNRTIKEAKHCNFKCSSKECTSEEIAVRDQIIIGTSCEKIREEALKQSWNLEKLRREGMKIESALHGIAELSGESQLNKVGRYSKRYANKQAIQEYTPKVCHFCGYKVSTSIVEHVKLCKARKATCNRCKKFGHYEQACRSKPVTKIEEEDTEKEIQKLSVEDYNVTIFNISLLNISALSSPNKEELNDFRTQLIINNHLSTTLVDTGAKISACSVNDAKKWGLLEKAYPSKHKIKPYNSPAIPVKGIAKCAVTHGMNSIPVEWYIIEGSCEPVLSGQSAKQLGIIDFKPVPKVFQPINMIKSKEKDEIQQILSKYPHNFQGLGKLKNHQIKLHVNPEIKPIVEPQRTIPYHLQERANKVLEDMIKNDVLEEHPASEPAPWISNVVISPKNDGSLRMTLDARNINKAIESSNLPIPRQEDIKVKLQKAKVFSKMDFKSAFWQLELHPDSRYLTTFYGQNKLLRYKRLTMGVKPAQGELNTALRPKFAHIPHTHLIHDDLILAAPNTKEHNTSLEEIMKAIEDAGITLNPDKCIFGKSKIKFWGLIISEEGISADPDKVDALKDLKPPNNKDELISFICMMQSNAEFIPNFAKESAILRNLTKSNCKFRWGHQEQKAFENLIEKFKKETLFSYFDMNKPTYLFTDAHQSGFGAMLAQGDNISTARPIVLASRTTNTAEKHYPQIDLEATGIDFALRRFRNYILGSPEKITIVTDHQPLCAIFNGRKKGSIRTDRIKLRHQDVRYEVVYQKGKANQADYLSRHAIPLENLTAEIQSEAEEMNKLLFLLHTTPITDTIGIRKICEETKTDKTLKKLSDIIKNKGHHFISKTAPQEIRKFSSILGELTVSGNGLILKGERIVLPKNLHHEAIELAHRGAHPGQSGLTRRLRNHFFFHDMDKKVQDYVSKCSSCSTFIDKKTKEPLKPHIIPNKCWEKVAVDLFGPMPSSKHVVVVQDLKSRFPSAKLVTSTSADNVIPALGDIYDTYGNPNIQLTDNGPPFNGKKMEVFTKNRDIEHQTTAPYHPSSNPAENFMRPLGKAMKIGYNMGEKEATTLKDMLKAYQQTPHPSTGIAPAAMLFRDGLKASFPRQSVSDQDVKKATELDIMLKEARNRDINKSKYRKSNTFKPGDKVLIRNANKKQKFEQTFLKTPFEVIMVDEKSNKVAVKMDNKVLFRHPDDLKFYHSDEENSEDTNNQKDFEEDELLWPEFEFYEDHKHLSSYFESPENQLRRSTRIQNQNPKYKDFIC